ncbi:DNA-binding transcriptional MocR family regulator [Actinocorallia herbida]|uniref:DNA-binding transcriptional MocR family regulator n=1 Tax=Actinocorallia herbida TaxID=58109 RepID=A0A3N1DA64_9ACTN|nr:aminotransferase class I/II-fold pyridoxal phosphate-dependent enzyme [Actinocorallia herbida]ROO90394.1 DNA-binding transcriptional MocR family regulator [Actinocorallia herbida]
MTSQNVVDLHAKARQDYEAFKARGLKLDLTRGKPAPAQLDLSNELLTLPGEGLYKSADGTDLRNYGGLTGIPEMAEIFAEGLQVPAAQLLPLGNASLAVMHDTLVYALFNGVAGGEGRWIDQDITFLCPVPGYDRHFALTERYGIKMVTVPMTDEGPDMDVVEELVAGDASIKGIWCVPKYSNPTGASYGDETVRRLAAMPTAAADFRIFWDNAYAVHHLTDEHDEILDVLAAAAEAGNPDRVFVFGSTSKVTFAGSGVAFFGSSAANVKWFTGFLGKGTIGPDKINQLRHVQFLKDSKGLAEHMRKHAEIVKPKFDAVERILSERLGGTGLATWTQPKGGYFVSLDVPEGTAQRVVELAKEAGVALTPAGATHPYGDDPADRTIRIAPTFPVLSELEVAIEGLATCVLVAGYEKQL